MARGKSETADLVYGVHPVEELLRSRPREVERVFAVRGPGPGLGRVLRVARQAGIPITHLPRELLARKLGGRRNHQGVAAAVAPRPYADTEALVRTASASPAAMLVLLDGVMDPQNLGAALRASAAAGVRGVILGGEGSAGLTPAVMRASAGAAERVAVGRELKPSRRLAGLREAGFRALALDPRGAVPWDRADLRGRIIIVAGAEGKGLRPGVLREADQRIAIPLEGGVESLNVAVALGVLLFEALRQRRLEQGGP